MRALQKKEYARTESKEKRNIYIIYKKIGERERENISAAEEREREIASCDEKSNASRFTSKPRGGGVGVDGEDAEGNAGENREGAKILLRRED